MFHKHNWNKIMITSAPPSTQELKFKGMDYFELHQFSLMGVTTILWECSICKNTKQETMLGQPIDVYTKPIFDYSLKDSTK